MEKSIRTFRGVHDVLTCFFGELCEGLYSLFSVAALGGNGGDVRPSQGPDDVHHGLGLERVRRNHPREEVVAPVVTQLRGCGRVADLRDLEREEEALGRLGKHSLMCWCCCGSASHLVAMVTVLIKTQFSKSLLIHWDVLFTILFECPTFTLETNLSAQPMTIGCSWRLQKGIESRPWLFFFYRSLKWILLTS